MKVLGLAGRSGSGKDYLAGLLQYSQGFYPVSFADQLKVVTALEYGYSYVDVFHNKPPEIRSKLQEMGVNAREMNPDVWIEALEMWLARWYERWGVEKFVVTDVRFPNEADWVREKMGGKVIRLESDRPNSLTPEQRQHPSETLVDTLTVDAYVNNDSHILRNELELAATVVLREWGWAKP